VGAKAEAEVEVEVEVEARTSLAWRTFEDWFFKAHGDCEVFSMLFDAN
jgi:hypothetical protein